MEKEFIPYEQALALKELGFDEPCFMFYEQETNSKYLQKGIDDNYWGDWTEPRDWNSMPNKPWKPFCQCISAPLYQQVFRWFREEYNLDSYLKPEIVKGVRTYDYYIWIDNNEDLEIGMYKLSSYEEAELECLKKLIELVKEKK